MSLIITVYGIALIVGLITIYVDKIEIWNEKHLLSRKNKIQ